MLLEAALFVFLVFLLTSFNWGIFFKTHVNGRVHRVMGCFYLFWLLLGSVHQLTPLLSLVGGASEWSPGAFLLYDVCLGVAGTLLTLSAAYEFPHHHVVNEASGPLERHATVTQPEMIEHSFYQVLNLVQICSLHLLPPVAGCVATTAPWLLRRLFPVHSFSRNYSSEASSGTAGDSRLIRLMYRAKKYQYVFFKHCLLHGLNLSVALSDSIPCLALLPQFRIYWMCINASYVLEFFLQTLVKKRRMTQQFHLKTNRVLMAIASAAALPVLYHVNPLLAISSLLLNFSNRHHDFANTMVILAVGLILRLD